MKSTGRNMNDKTDDRNTVVDPAGQRQGGPDQSRFHPLEVLVRRRWQFLLCMLLVCVVTVAATKFRKVNYEAAARVEVTMHQPQLGGVLGTLAMGGGSDYFNTQWQLLSSQRVLTRAAQVLSEAGCSWAAGPQGAEELEQRLRVKRIAGSRLIDIVGVSADPAQAAAIASEITGAFIITSKLARQEATARTIANVGIEIAQCEERIRTQTDAINHFRREHLITGDDRSLAAVEGRIATIEQQLTQVQLQRMKLAAQRDRIQHVLSTGRFVKDYDGTFDAINRHPRVASLQKMVEQLRQQESELAATYLPGHENLSSVRLRLGQVEFDLIELKHRLVQSWLDDTNAEYAAAQRRERELRQLEGEQKQLGVVLTERHAEYRSMITSLLVLEQFRQRCLAQVREVQLAERVWDAPVVVVDAAQVPRQPAGLSRSQQAASILLLGLLFSITSVFVVDRLATSVSVPASAEAQSVPMMYVPAWNPAWANQSAGSMPAAPSEPASVAAFDGLLGSVGRIELGGDSDADQAFAARCRVVHADQGSPQAATFRAVSTKLLSRFGGAPQSLVITATQSNSGTTTCACNLALALAQTNRRVLLIDANFDNPSLARVFSSDADHTGIGEVWTDASLLDHAVQPSDADNLDVITQPGQSRDISAETFAADAITMLNAQLLHRYDWVIYDVGSAESDFAGRLLADVGRALVVTAADDAEAAEQIEHRGAVSLGCLDNAAPTTAERTDPSNTMQNV